ncbi:type II toxin-antitoxin system HicB family antitoxin [Stappia sp. TSB10GB4]|uniref:type II toxin-antitoxin system HicB family antitoxin n=1 Tax=Stappia sp. TSB10GB4 TaxID=2003584 RepID=UPI0016454204|nr:type II toxin-antitoxin system HicB family antitoxin [Stappia sp. TSB10GB4]
MKTIRYKGFQGAVDWDNGVLFVRVLHVDDVLIAECARADEVESVFRDLVDAYIEDCVELGKEPQKPFSGSFNVRVSPEVHARAAMAAADEGVTLNRWVASAIEERLKGRFEVNEVFSLGAVHTEHGGAAGRIYLKSLDQNRSWSREIDVLTDAIRGVRPAVGEHISRLRSAQTAGWGHH